MHKKIVFILFISVFFAGTCLTVYAHGDEGFHPEDVYKSVGVAKPRILPTSAFYFIKNIGRSIELLFTFDRVKKAERELTNLDEKLAELGSVIAKEPNEKDAHSKALQNYLEAHTRLQKRLESLRGKNKNIDELLKKLAERVAIHQALFRELREELADREVNPALEKINESAKKASELDEKKFKEKLEEVTIEKPDTTPLGQTEEKPSICTQQYDPVCGVDGKTYSNSCFAGVAGVQIKTKGECDTSQESNKPAPPQNSSAPSVKPEPKTTEVNIQNFSFSPQEIRIPLGARIKWTNRDSVGHTATADLGAFGSQLLAQGESYQFTFDRKGEYTYFCTPHPNMRGKIIVE